MKLWPLITLLSFDPACGTLLRGLTKAPREIETLHLDSAKYIGSISNDSIDIRSQLLQLQEEISDATGNVTVRVTSDGDAYAYMMIRKQPDPNKNPHSRELGITMSPPSSEDDFVLESVIGEDTRSRVSSSPGWPYWRVGKLENPGCTGTIVGKNKVLTNAHCVYDFNENRWQIPHTFKPGMNPSSTRFGTWSVDTADILQSYVNDGHRDHDYAILTMRTNSQGRHIGDELGYFPIKAATCEELDGRYKKRIVGYPGDKPHGTMWTSGVCDDWNYFCGDLTVNHKCDTYPGNSGSGILMYYTDGTIGVVGVHAFGFSGSGQWNGGPAFTTEVAEMLNGWVDEPEEPPPSPPTGGSGTCVWTAWLEECSNGGTLIKRSSLTDFKTEMSKQGNDGKHLVAADYADGVWMGFFEELPGTWRWVVRTDYDEFVAEANSALTDGYRAEALVAGDGVYLAWYRAVSGIRSSFRGRDGNTNFQDALNEMLDDGMHMTAALGFGGDYWFAWFEAREDTPAGWGARWSHVYSVTSLQESINKFHADGYYVTSIVHIDGWVLWGERAAGSSGWATRSTQDGLWDWITDNWNGHCVSAITHGCD